MAHANDRANPEDYVRLSSALLLMYGVGAITGPFLASAVMTVIGATGLYVYIGAIHGVLAIYIVCVSLLRKAVASDQTVDFTDALTSCLTSSHVYDEECLGDDEDSE